MEHFYLLDISKKFLRVDVTSSKKLSNNRTLTSITLADCSTSGIIVSASENFCAKKKSRLFIASTADRIF